ncbi:solute carrier family 25 (mitochondrial S-adenosylmethionine transporter), member 26 [Mytilus galloprovincialis]|uniref:Solute carrier family 25 (Mitochondrial S-adenosylmethionine transporter), member 26 n=1 Tax=Mytilus galloprovincialis TaxID=29158 RepID=A0A8B6CPZ9_MYTGA|nr:solute carrier family 25 (mitochondrial S-adenosylmethionine transporter), member 26 [Mytilus galloprovincialis]
MTYNPFDAEHLDSYIAKSAAKRKQNIINDDSSEMQPPDVKPSTINQSGKQNEEYVTRKELKDLHRKYKTLKERITILEGKFATPEPTAKHVAEKDAEVESLSQPTTSTDHLFNGENLQSVRGIDVVDTLDPPDIRMEGRHLYYIFNAAVFFCTYETTKNFASSVGLSKSLPIVHMAGASFGEMTCCLIRVPVEVIKQRAQVFTNTSSYSVLRNTLQSEGFRGLYRGYLSTVIREVPFSFMQFPMWEYFKILWSREQGKPVDPWQSSICGAVAGSIASGITTPLDVAKTRIMLAEDVCGKGLEDKLKKRKG